MEYADLINEEVAKLHRGEAWGAIIGCSPRCRLSSDRTVATAHDAVGQHEDGNTMFMGEWSKSRVDKVALHDVHL
eukprot:6492173-Amphidinium_carterae.3